MDDEGDVREEGCIRRVWRVPRGHSPILRKHRFSSDTPRVLTTPLPYHIHPRGLRPFRPRETVNVREVGKGRVRVCAARGRAATPVLRPVPPAVESPFGDPVRYDRA